MNGFGYLPNIDFNKFVEYIKTDNWNNIPELIKNLSYERVGIDRLLTILIDMKNTFGTFSGYNILDVGCNNGLISIGLAACDNNVIGIDNFEIDKQKRYSKFLLSNNILNRQLNLRMESIDTLLKKDKSVFDIILLLSVTHQWEYGYAHLGEVMYETQEIKYIMNNILGRFKYAVYYECPIDEPGYEIGYGRKFLEKYIDNIENYKITEIDITVASNGYLRQLLRIERM